MRRNNNKLFFSLLLGGIALVYGAESKTAPSCTDADRDGYYAEGSVCGTPIDCDDNDSSVYPGAFEICGDGVDNNCNGLIDSVDTDALDCTKGCADQDGDGYSGDGGICGPVDCDDSNSAVNPGVRESCEDGVDNNCNGKVDAMDAVCQERGAVTSDAMFSSSVGAYNVLDFGILVKDLKPGQLSARTLSSWGLNQSEIDMLMQATTSTERSSVPNVAASNEAASADAVDTAQYTAASPDPRYAVVASWPIAGHRVYLRQGYWTGTTGFGYAKITQYHNLSVNAVKATTMYPRSTVKQNGTTWRYETPVAHVQCRGWWIFRRCRITEVISVYAAVNYRPMPDGTTFGVVTSFCSKYVPRCPDWAKNALNI